MIDPVIALLAVAAFALAGVLLFRPSAGWFWRWWRARRSSERVLVEDALKHVYDCEYLGQACTLQSLSGSLELGARRVAELVRRLEQLELVESGDSGYRLTADGRRDALRVIRLHRLYELYLADETGVDPSEWHHRAEIHEHRLSPPEAESLARRMGYPRYDPHGDPIPTEDGEIGPPRGAPMNKLAVGRVAEIVHVEDEPDAVYAQLVAEGLHPGMRVRIIEKTPEAIHFESDTEEHVLAPVFVANLWTRELSEADEAPEPVRRLSDLRRGERATVSGISNRTRGLERRRLLDLGIVPGTVVEIDLVSPGGDPVAYRIRGAVIALRREQTDLVEIEPDAPSESEGRVA